MQLLEFDESKAEAKEGGAEEEQDDDSSKGNKKVD
jgi:minor histocompatibility antigen H13